ncbi:MAG: LacI family transcriptional regulator [Eubacteriales bacterium]|nr:LacI family transcriptional regulator [Eubacteriales bacterium]
MAATIHDVAKLAGVNPSTVSRVLNGKASISEETKEKIYAAMQQLDYHMNSVARSLASGLSGAIGVVMDAQDANAFSNEYFSRSLFAIEQVAQAMGYNVIIANSAKRAANSASIEDLMLERKVDGLILPPSTVKLALLKKVGDFPYVVLGQPDIGKQGASWVDVNNEQGAALAVEHFYAQGYKHLAYIGGDESAGFVKRRIKGYRGALNAGSVAMVHFTDGTTEDAGYVALEAMNTPEPPDAFLCNDNLTAFGALKALKAAGWRVPEQIGLVVFDNYPLAAYTDPPLTAVNVDTAMLGEETARLLFQRIERRVTNRQTMLCTSLIERESSRRM